MFQIGSFLLTEEVVARRKAYLEIGPADEQRLREAHPHLQKQAASIIDRFYEYLLAHEHTRAALSSPGTVERLKRLQTEYFVRLTAGTYDLGYFEDRLRVGQAHHRIGLSPEWYLGAYVKYLHIATDVLSSTFGRDYERFYQTLISLTKVIYLDMGLALDAYHFSAQAGLETANEQLRRLQAAKRQLTDMIVHDLQNPLTGVTAALQVIHGQSSALTDGERQALEEALRRCNDLSQMILNVLQVSRAETGRVETYLENHDLVALAREVTDGFRRAAEMEQRTLRLEMPDAAPVRVDQTLLRRILENLLRNAIRHTPKGTTVTVRVTRAADGATLSVIDEGPGIPPEIHPLLFEPYGAAALRNAGRRVDTGLGLASCRVAARAMGTDIRVESDGRRGTAFHLPLPPASR